MASLNNQHVGDIPSKCETGTRVLIRSSNCCAQTLPVASIAPSRLVIHLPRNGDIVPATDLIVLIARPCVGGTPWIYSTGYPTVCKVLR
jgi:hypothetical protein